MKSGNQLGGGKIALKKKKSKIPAIPGFSQIGKIGSRQKSPGKRKGHKSHQGSSGSTRKPSATDEKVFLSRGDEFGLDVKGSKEVGSLSHREYVNYYESEEEKGEAEAQALTLTGRGPSMSTTSLSIKGKIIDYKHGHSRRASGKVEGGKGNKILCSYISQKPRKEEGRMKADSDNTSHKYSLPGLSITTQSTSPKGNASNIPGNTPGNILGNTPGNILGNTPGNILGNTPGNISGNSTTPQVKPPPLSLIRTPNFSVTSHLSPSASPPQEKFPPNTRSPGNKGYQVYQGYQGYAGSQGSRGLINKQGKNVNANVNANAGNIGKLVIDVESSHQEISKLDVSKGRSTRGSMELFPKPLNSPEGGTLHTIKSQTFDNRTQPTSLKKEISVAVISESNNNTQIYSKRKIQPRGTKQNSSPSKKASGGILSLRTSTQGIDFDGLVNRPPRKGITSTALGGGVTNSTLMGPSMDGHSLITQVANSLTRSSKIKVVARFRPLNYVEMDLISAGMGRPCCLFEENSRNIIFEEEHLTFSMDNVFSPQGRQENIYNFIAKETIEDVLNGYNGTIFAYGQTGSGKTYTMFGPDLYDTELMGIIPRAARHIFQKINNCELEVDFEIRCSMLEIYKEKLSDLLPENPNNELKIKESPTRGIYVAGLNEICVVYEEEILDLIEAGNEMRHVSETRANKFSSRSHTIFRIQISQKFPNGSEKRGVLNLVDLAGSEKVGKTGATGETLEEATKINLSLSCIGNVIHALVLKADHVPYRDSKLTRILQECLGGNYKTSLVVTCSNHSFHKEETISSLRFAQRARSIKNQVKMNIKSSPEQLQAIIDHLKTELSKTKKENSILRLRLQKIGDIEITNESLRQSSEYRILETMEDGAEALISSEAHINLSPISGDELDISEQSNLQASPTKTLSKTKSFTNLKKPLVSPKVCQPGAKLGDTTRTIREQIKKAKQSRRGKSESRVLLEGEEDIDTMEEYNKKFKINYDSESDNNSQQITELIHQSDLDRMKITSLRAEIDCLVREKQELRDELQKYKHESTKYKKKCIAKERTMQEITEKKKSVKYEKLSNTRMDKHHEVEIETLKSQLKSLKDSLIDAENECIRLLKERQEIFEGSYDQFRDIPFFDLKLTEYLRKEKFQNDLSEKKWMRGMKETGMKVKAEDPWEESIFKNIIYIPLEESKVLERNKYGEEITQAMSGMSHEAHIYLLRGQLSEAGILNHNLKRVICALHWRVVIESGKGKIKTDLADTLQDNLEHLHSLLERTQNSHQTLRQRMEKFEFEMMDLRHKYHDAANNYNKDKLVLQNRLSNNKLISASFIGKSRILKTFSKHLNKGENVIARSLGKGRRLMTLNRLGVYHHLGSKYNPILNTSHYIGNTSFANNNNYEQEDIFPKLNSAQPNLYDETGIPVIVEMGEPDGFREEKDFEFPPSNIGVKTNDFIPFGGFTAFQTTNKGVSDLERAFTRKESACGSKSPFSKQFSSGMKDLGEYNMSGMENIMLDEIEKLEDKVICAQNELQLQTGRAEQIMAGYNDLKKQVETLKFVNSELEHSSHQVLEQESESWQNKMNELIESSTRELRRKQRELGKLHEHLAEWVIKYMDLESKMSMNQSVEDNELRNSKTDRIISSTTTVEHASHQSFSTKLLSANKVQNLGSGSKSGRAPKMLANLQGDIDNIAFEDPNSH